MTSQLIHPEGPSLSRIVAGAWRWHTVPPDTLDRLMRTALDLGITTFDHADIYGDHGNEEMFGSLLRANPSLRAGMQTITKCGIKLVSGRRPAHRIKHYDSSAEYIVACAENSLRLLGVDKIDVLLIHRPDPLMDPDEVARAFTRLKQEGKVRYFGVSNFTSSQFDLLQGRLPMPLVTNQIEISLFLPGLLFDGTVDGLMRHRVCPMAWSPLGGGKFLAGETEAGRRVLEGLRQLGPRLAASPGQLLLAWLLRHPARILPVIGTTKPDRILECAKSLAIDLGREDWFEMLRWVTGRDVA